MKSHEPPAVWFPAIRVGTGTDSFTQRLCEGLNACGVRAEVTWLPLRAEYAPWSVCVPPPPRWANIVHANSWMHPRFLPEGLPIVATVHHAVHHPDALAWKGSARAAYHKYWIAPIERRVLRRASCVMAVSRFVAEATNLTLLDVPTRVIHNGVDTDRFRPGSRQRGRGEPFRLLYVGSWMARKGVDLLAPIMRELGEGYELRYTGGYEARKEASRMPANMHDIGRLQSERAVIEAMQAADTFIFPSRSEGFGLVVAEAMACGLPVVASDIPVLSEIVEHGNAGVLCPVNDRESFAAAVRDMATNSALLRDMAAAARRRSVESFSMPAMLRLYLESYDALLGSIGSNSSP